MVLEAGANRANGFRWLPNAFRWLPKAFRWLPDGF
jgi:hypothetical protein